MTTPLVALVGRPNVGKSTLFNRIVGRRVAIVEDFPGTTRDRLYAEADWGGYDFLLVDTGGLEFPQAGGETGKSRQVEGQTAGIESGLFLEEMRQQVLVAMEDADVIVLLVDVAAGLTPQDYDVANLLRRSGRPVILAVNKADNPRLRADAVEFYALGLGEPVSVSALHGQGVGDLLDLIIQAFGPIDETAFDDSDHTKIAIVGRPNVGKSSLLNKLLGQERVIVSDIPGTTRDAIDMEIEVDDERVTLIDTAGIRRRGQIAPGIEKYSVLRALKAINRADVCLLVIDAQDMVTAQDQHIGGYILREEKSVVVVVNKWDAIEKDTHTMQEYTQALRSRLGFLDYVPVLFVSAKTGQRVKQILNTALQVQQERLHRISTGDLNRILQDAVAHHPPKNKAGRQLKFYYATQADTDPPTFVFFVNNRKLLHFTYERYLENRIREFHGFLGTPLRLLFRSRGDDTK
jgi:GTPase